MKRWRGSKRPAYSRVIAVLVTLATTVGAVTVVTALAPNPAAAQQDQETSTSQPLTIPETTDPVAFSAGGPPGVVNVTPGSTVETEIRITNESTRESRFKLEIVTLEAGDSGELKLTDRENPFSNAITTAENVSVAARTAQRVQVRIAVPAKVDPDTYFVGVAASAEPENGGTAQVLRIVVPITLRVPSGQSANLSVKFNNPRIVWGRDVKGSYDITNLKGSSASVERSLRLARLGSDVNVAEQSGGPTELVLAGRHKSFDWRARVPATHVGFAQPKLDATYVDENELRTTAHFSGPRILVLTPFGLVVIIAALILLVVITALIIRTIRRRRAVKNAAPGKHSAADGSVPAVSTAAGSDASGSHKPDVDNPEASPDGTDSGSTGGDGGGGDGGGGGD